MFYDLILLRQSRGKLGLAWLAATRGILHLKKKEIVEINIENLCNEITDYICSSSSSARQRFSLRLSAILINGIVKIYREQAAECLRLIVEYLTVIRVPTVMQLSSDEIPTITRIHRVKTKSKKPRRKGDAAQVDTPLEDLLANIQSQEVFTPQELDNIEKTIDKAQPITTSAANITLIELTKPTVEDEEYQFGVIDEKELQMLLGEPVPVPPQERVPVPEPQTLTQIETQIPTITVREPDQSIQPSNVITVVADVHAPAGEYLEGTLPPPPRSSQQDRQIGIETIQEVLTEQQQRISPEKRPAKRRRQASESRRVMETSREKFADSKLFIQMKPKTTRTIDRTEKYEMKHLKRHKLFELQFDIITTATTILLLDRYHLTPRPDEEVTVVVREDSTSKKSSVIAPIKKTIEHPSEVMLEQEQKIVEMETSEIPQPVRETIITPQSQLPIGDHQIESTPLTSKVQITPEIVAETPVQQSVPAARLPPQEPMEIDSVIQPVQPVAVDSSEIRQQNIIEKVLRAGIPLKIEDVCPEPINRLKIAKTFSDLLVLCKAGYVALEGDEFCELKFIHKGRRFTTEQ